jgi:hypothetical protein
LLINSVFEKEKSLIKSGFRAGDERIEGQRDFSSFSLTRCLSILAALFSGDVFAPGW